MRKTSWLFFLALSAFFIFLLLTFTARPESLSAKNNAFLFSVFLHLLPQTLNVDNIRRALDKLTSPSTWIHLFSNFANLLDFLGSLLRNLGYWAVRLSVYVDSVEAPIAPLQGFLATVCVVVQEFFIALEGLEKVLEEKVGGNVAKVVVWFYLAAVGKMIGIGWGGLKILWGLLC